MQTQKKIKVIGTQEYINASTGELVEMQVTDIEERDFNFHKLWLRNFIATLDIIGNQKTKLCFWIIDHLDRENKLCFTQRQIADMSGVGIKTVNLTMQILTKADFLRKVNQSVMMINPNIIYKGRRQSRVNMLNIYHDATPYSTSDEQKLEELKAVAERIQQQIIFLSQKLKKEV